MWKNTIAIHSILKKKNYKEKNAKKIQKRKRKKK